MLRRLAFAALVALGCTFASAADKPREIHGSSDAFATQGVTLAWGVLRAGGDAQPIVDVRISVDPMTYPRVVVTVRDPFGSRERVLADSLTAGLSDLRASRATYERYPRTEFRFYATTKHEPGESPALVVYFLGVPDTTPEFTSESKLDAYLTERVVRLRAAQPKSP
jgi:hypothetical protein